MARREADTLAEIVAAIAPVEGREVLDVGCGHGRLCAALCRRGARMSAIDPEASAIAAARAAAPGARVEQAGAEAMPFADESFDAVVALNSLHHVPGKHLEAALAGMARVARAGAPVVIVEPLAEGSYFETMRPLEDETAIRAAAQAAITQACGSAGQLRFVAMDEFERVEPFRDVARFIERLVAVNPARKARLSDGRQAIEKLFEAQAAAAPTGFTWCSVRVDCVV